MEQQKKIYAYNNPSDKHYFAALLNQADHNFRMALVELGERCHLKHAKYDAADPKTGDKEVKRWINDTLPDNISQHDWNYRIEIWSNYLPVIGVLSKIKKDNKEEIRKAIHTLYEVLMCLRNYYTHLHHEPIDLWAKAETKDIYTLLDAICLDAAQEVRRRRLKSGKYVPDLPKQFRKDYEQAIKSYEEKNKQTKQLRKEEERKAGFDLKAFRKKHPEYKTEDFDRIYLNNSISHIISKDKETGELRLKDMYLSQHSEDEKQLSKNGFLFLLGLFISRREAEDMLDHTQGLKADHRLSFLITRWMFTVYSFKGIRKSLRSDFASDALLLDMASYLSQCPHELYEVLANDKKQEFVMAENVYYKDNEENTDSPEEARVSHLVIRKRYEDKFAYFAIRFLDEYANFPSLRFQLRLGKYNHDTREKHLKGMAGKIITERNVLEDFKVFGKLSEVYKAKKESFGDEGRSDNAIGWRQYPDVSYAIANNNIPIYIDKGKKTRLLNELKIKNIYQNEPPTALLSINELPAMLAAFFAEKDVENTIRDKAKAQYAHIEHIDSSTDGNKKNTPKSLLKLYKEGTEKVGQIDFAKLDSAISTEIEKCEERQCKFAEAEQKHKKKQEEKAAREKDKTKKRTPYKLGSNARGEIATWLANDIKRYATKAERVAWKGYQHAELQALLAFYDTKRTDIKLFIEKEIGVNIAQHPILGSLFDKTKFEEFYQGYLDMKIEVLQGYKTLIKENKENYSSAPKQVRKAIDKLFEHYHKKLYQYAPANHIEHLLTKPVNLPRGIFDDTDKTIRHYCDKNKDNRMAWFAQAEDAAKQLFYAYPREYTYTDSADNEQEVRIDSSIHLNTLPHLPDEVKKRIIKTEKAIRQSARQDHYILRMIEYMFAQLKVSVADDNKFTLRDAFLEKANKQETLAEAHSQSRRSEGDRSENIVKVSHLLEKRIDIALFGNKIRQKNIALKDVGKYRALEKDVRVKQLLEYGHRDNYTADEIISEIENYEKVRKNDIFRAVHYLEDRIYKQAEAQGETAKLKKDNNPNFSRYIQYRTQLSENDVKNDLRVIVRNIFSHNQLPSKKKYCEMLGAVSRNDLAIGDYLLAVFRHE